MLTKKITTIVSFKSLTLLLLLYSSHVAGQEMVFFTDSVKKPLDRVYTVKAFNNHFILGGASVQPNVYMIDTLGNTIWNTSSYDESPEYKFSAHIDDLLVSDDNHIYASSTTGGLTDRKEEIWKIDSKDGRIKWQFANDSLTDLIDVQDFSETQIVAVFWSFLRGEGHVPFLTFLNRETGQPDSLTALRDLSGIMGQSGPYDFRFKVMEDQSIIYHFRNNEDNPTYFRLSNGDYQSFDWTKKIDVKTYHQLLVYEGDILLNEGDKNTLLRINGQTGETIWAAPLKTDFSAQLTHFFIDETQQAVYCLFNETSVIKAARVDLQTGQVLWKKGYPFRATYNNNIGLLHNKLFIAGEDRDTEDWMVFSVDTESGDWLQKSNLTEAVDKSMNSDPHMIEMKDRLYVFSDVGESDGIPYRTQYFLKSAMFKMDSTGLLETDTSLGGHHPLRSYPVKVASFADYTLVLMQYGAQLGISKYDFKNQLVWRKFFSKPDFLIPGALSVSENGTIYMSCMSLLIGDGTSKGSEFYYQSYPGLDYVFELDRNGETIHEYELAGNDVNGQISYVLPLKQGAQAINWRGNHQLIEGKITAGRPPTITCRPLGPWPQTFYFREIRDFRVPIGADSKFFYDYSDSLYVGKASIYRTGNSFELIGINKYTGEYEGTCIPIIEDGPVFSYYPLANDHLLNHGYQREQFTLERTEFLSYFTPDSFEEKWRVSFDEANIYNNLIDTVNHRVFAIGNNGSEAFLNVLNLEDGSMIHTQTLGLDHYVNASAIDLYRDKVYVTGKVLTASGSKPFLQEIDMNSFEQSTTYQEPEFDGLNEGTVVYVAANGSVFFGGTLNQNSLGKSGFIQIYKAPLFEEFVVTNTFTDLEDQTHGMNVYPNPSRGSVTLTNEGGDASLDVAVHKLTGQKVVEFGIPPNAQITKHFNPGMYIIKFINSDGDMVSKKLLVQ